ncbi:succinylglutamate desuccinylase/aspartoacylase family protein [Psychrobium sp. 1_MG-2023]|uniref:succinylglutamate desuccinylase/aspartoacylase domain-containing protein n=1 Tax=Psychrobium sp. 1_MG-2023 TaxID=3062624 RepID=UPI000C3426E2|nr:succinylglutamate desuccinylase/aspartoacylase family protein [Psychrobium sp. 1_MG-2023]MDP2562328.1 succinylglutamate desuccinylase/aspartoacylase family protein [Psychrobium sp. 1_MG-2023]PKF58062.1 hypothetical protein CW748_04480 [Alteromonadales bacterium alter-6D02]
MDIDFNEVSYLSDPEQVILGADYQQFLLSLTCPTVIDIKGQDPSRCRVFTTLLHGNEPSGLIAIHRWLTNQGQQPVPLTNMRFIICSVEAATAKPLLSHRYLEGGKDINRCFTKPTPVDYGLRAALIKQAISEVSPELVIDLHNTSGSGPAFAVSPLLTSNVLALASYFCQTMILSGIHLGALMEQDFGCPIITIECGGSNDEQAHHVAYHGLKLISRCEDVNKPHQEKSIDIISKPLRLTINDDVELAYSEHDEGFDGVTLKSTIEQFNYGSATQGQLLGWVDHLGLANLSLIGDEGEDLISDYFCVKGNQLLCAKHLKVFMATTIAEIAKADCLFYLTADQHNGR